MQSQRGEAFLLHKFALKSELGGLIGNATSNKSGLMSSGMVPLELSKDNNQYCKISVFMPNAGSINESVISVTNVGGDSFSVAVSMIRWNTNKVFCKLINGTKISNINMYYTVDTDRFCFYIKANWYAKIVVSRLGLVNTSKIESINAIPSEAIEVPIYWRDKRYSTDLGELIGNTYSSFTLAKGEETLIANGTGVYYVSNSYLDSVSTLVVIDYDNSYVLGGVNYRIKFRVQESHLYATALSGEESVRVRNIAHK